MKIALILLGLAAIVGVIANMRGRDGLRWLMRDVVLRVAVIAVLVGILAALKMSF